MHAIIIHSVFLLLIRLTLSVVPRQEQGRAPGKVARKHYVECTFDLVKHYGGLVMVVLDTARVIDNG
jgi:hypothetical protein